MLFDAEARLVAANRLATTIAGLDPALLRRGERLADLIRAQVQRGEFGHGAVAAAPVELALASDRRQPSHYTRRRPDGAVVEVTSDPTPDGCIVLTSSDITAQARREAAA